jgi:hypothetical protein
LLTSFAEGVHIKNYDCHRFFSVQSLGNLEWLVIRKTDLVCGPTEDAATQFVRPRTVQIRGSTMICSCLEYIRRQHPCRHMAAVFQCYDNLHFQPHHFHIRWWNVFGYYYESHEEANESLISCLSHALDQIRSSCYIDGKYIGINISESELLIFQSLAIDSDEKNLMMKLRDYCKTQVLIRQRETHHHLLNGTEEDEGDCFGSYDNENMGGSTQSIKMLSDFNSQVNSIDVVTKDTSLDHIQILSIFKEKTYALLPFIKTADDLRKCEDTLDMLLMTLSNTTLNAQEDTFGYLGERKVTMRRFKYAFER